MSGLREGERECMGESVRVSGGERKRMGEKMGISSVIYP